ncbi:MFS transporter [Microlunatus soli]|uniref:Drug resistance transporter, EmrB/QacA subfamily n=1 Tax=Microlunatus soli TaxID=630515 RepID=A0A1H2AC69_9ACTN|nr:MFS transporter [Microlunatus soli]SDT43484.1 drug resistance transporter, EmrB/QacA subfamily [Microlunatus soli]
MCPEIINDRQIINERRGPNTRTRRIRRRLVLVLACAAQAMVGVDMAIVNVALPSIQRDLGMSEAMLQWVVVSYGLLLGGFLLLGGRMTDRFGHRRILVAGLAVFTVASLVAGWSAAAEQLIVARAVQGLGAALITPAALSLLAVTFAEGAERNRVLGIFGAVGGISGSMGVVASGLLAAGPGWRWAFLINVPVGVVLLGLAVLLLAGTRPDATRTRLDLRGATTVTGGLLLLVYALQRAATDGRFSATSLVFFAAAVALLVAFVRIEARSPAPLVPRWVIGNRRFVAANITAFLTNSAFLSFIFVGSLLMQQGLGYGPTRTGLCWLATTATILPVAMAGGRLAARVRVRRLLLVGLALLALAALWLTRISADSGYLGGLLPAFLLAGVGFGLCGPSLQIGALAGVTHADAGLASGLLETVREIGGAAGVAAVTAVLVSGHGLTGFHTAFAVVALWGFGALICATLGFDRRRSQTDEEKSDGDVDLGNLPSSVG